MSQENLTGKKRISVEIKESYGGFEVCNPNHVDFADIEEAKPFRMGKEIVKKFKSYDEAKKSFEEECKEKYKSDVLWMKSKFSDSDGCFWLNGVKVNWKLRTFYITTYHLEFNTENKTPCLLTETGYRSEFPTELDYYDSVEKYLVEYIEYRVNGDEKEKKKKKPIKYNLDWKSCNSPKQLTLTELKGGLN